MDARGLGRDLAERRRLLLRTGCYVCFGLVGRRLLLLGGTARLLRFVFFSTENLIE
jgi:hypothetical protein